MKASVIEDVERYEVIDGIRVEREPMGAFETVVASWLCYLLNSFATGKNLGLAVSEVLFVLDAAGNLKRRPDVAFVSYARWSTALPLFLKPILRLLGRPDFAFAALIV